MTRLKDRTGEVWQLAHGGSPYLIVGPARRSGPNCSSHPCVRLECGRPWSIAEDHDGPGLEAAAGLVRIA